MKMFPILVFGILLTINAKASEADYPKSDEITLRNQLLTDVYLLKEGVEKLLLSSEVLNRRLTNQMDILKTFQYNFKNGIGESEEVENSCDKISGMFNATIKKQNIIESRLIVKLEELQENQLANFEEMLIKMRLNKSCGTQTGSSNALALISTNLAEVNEKIEQIDKTIVKFALLEEKLNTQQTTFDKFSENQLKILQQINDKLDRNQQQFDKINRDITNLKDLTIDLKETITQPRPKLPMEVILGLSSANLTTFK